MHPEHQQIIIAQALGWTRLEFNKDGKLIGQSPETRFCASVVPNYVEDLNAMHKVEGHMNSHYLGRYLDILRNVVLETKQVVEFATAAQRAKAFLKLYGLWKMSPKQQQLALAEACGWRFSPYPVGGASVNNWEMPGGGYTSHCPDYLNNLNAMHDAVKKLTAEKAWQLVSYRQHLAVVCGGESAAIDASADQRAEALLKAKELWKE